MLYFHLKMHQIALGSRVPSGPAGGTYRYSDLLAGFKGQGLQGENWTEGRGRRKGEGSVGKSGRGRR